MSGVHGNRPSTYGEGGSLKAHPTQHRPLVEDRLRDLELRMESAEGKLSDVDAVNFDRRLREGL